MWQYDTKQIIIYKWHKLINHTLTIFLLEVLLRQLIFSLIKELSVELVFQLLKCQDMKCKSKTLMVKQAKLLLTKECLLFKLWQIKESPNNHMVSEFTIKSIIQLTLILKEELYILKKYLINKIEQRRSLYFKNWKVHLDRYIQWRTSWCKQKESKPRRFKW
jgi:hypothetical protein